MASQDIERSELDRVFDVLSHPYRRRILLLLTGADSRDEDEFSPEDAATEDDDLELLKTALFHRHLPKLDEARYIEWDRDTQTLRRGTRFEEIAPSIRLIHDHQDELPADWP